ncbi:DUF4097 family beta strand repeat-containing protein [Nonomuraea sp. NPDC003214]
MPTFDTPAPILATVDLHMADVRIHATDRADTVVRIRPAHHDTSDQVEIDYSRGRLLVRSPPATFRWLLWGGESIDVEIELPTGSRAEVKTTGELRCEGRLGDCRFQSADGDVWLDETGRLQVHAGNGDITVARSGPADITADNGGIRINRLDGAATIKTAHGDITLGEVTGDLRMKTAHGDITVDRALSDVAAKTATGNVRIGEVVRGQISLETASGAVEAGIRAGTAAYLDVRTDYGNAHIGLTPTSGPGQADETAELRAHTAYGDIHIRRATPTPH